jgi:hypothetical protein
MICSRRTLVGGIIVVVERLAR